MNTSATPPVTTVSRSPSSLSAEGQEVKVMRLTSFRMSESTWALVVRGAVFIWRVALGRVTVRRVSGRGRLRVRHAVSGAPVPAEALALHCEVLRGARRPRRAVTAWGAWARGVRPRRPRRSWGKWWLHVSPFIGRRHSIRVTHRAGAALTGGWSRAAGARAARAWPRTDPGTPRRSVHPFLRLRGVGHGASRAAWLRLLLLLFIVLVGIFERRTLLFGRTTHPPVVTSSAFLLAEEHGCPAIDTRWRLLRVGGGGSAAAARRWGGNLVQVLRARRSRRPWWPRFVKV